MYKIITLCKVKCKDASHAERSSKNYLRHWCFYIYLSLCLLHPFPSPFYSSTSLSLYYYHLLSLSLSFTLFCAICFPLSSQLSFALFIPLSIQFTLPSSLSFFFYLRYAFLSLSLRYAFDLLHKKSCGKLVNYAGGHVGETTRTASRRRLKCLCVNRSATFAKGRILRSHFVSLLIAKNSFRLLYSLIPFFGNCKIKPLSIYIYVQNDFVRNYNIFVSFTYGF